MRERDFQKQVIDLAHLYSWRVAHFSNTVKVVREKSGGYRTIGDTNAKGFPDLVLVRNGRLIFAELKTEKTKPTPDQIAWAQDLVQVPGVGMFLWRPSDLPEISKILK